MAWHDDYTYDEFNDLWKQAKVLIGEQIKEEL